MLARLAPLVVGALLLLIATIAVGYWQRERLGLTRGGGATGDLLGGAAPRFQLIDQSGAPLSLNSLRGKVVVLTFLYTNCPDICPVTLNKFGVVHDRLGDAAGDVAFVAITVDPARDDTAQLRAYLAAQHLTDKVSFLTGDRDTLEGIWRAYGIVSVDTANAAGEHSAHAYDVVHSDRIYLIGRDGRIVDLIRSTSTPQELLTGIGGALGTAHARAR